MIFLFNKIRCFGSFSFNFAKHWSTKRNNVVDEQWFSQIYDGYDSDAPELSSVCGLSPPQESITSSSNVVFIKFTGSFFREGNWFHLHWYQVPRVNTDTGNTVTRCEYAIVRFVIFLLQLKQSVFEIFCGFLRSFWLRGRVRPDFSWEQNGDVQVTWMAQRLRT